jgi:hypothetical protein
VLEAVLWIHRLGLEAKLRCGTKTETDDGRFCSSDSIATACATARQCCVANELRDKGVLDEEECFIDATFAMAKGGSAEVAPTKRGKGVKIMAIVDRHGLPLSVSTHAANNHEVRLIQLCFDFYLIEAKPENLLLHCRAGG